MRLTMEGSLSNLDFLSICEALPVAADSKGSWIASATGKPCPQDADCLLSSFAVRKGEELRFFTSSNFSSSEVVELRLVSQCHRQQDVAILVESSMAGRAGFSITWNSYSSHAVCSPGSYGLSQYGIKNAIPPFIFYNSNVTVEVPSSYSCVSCPSAKFSCPFASSSVDQCIQVCALGTFSVTSTEPCQPCPQASYANSSGQTSCFSCPPGFTTYEEGSDKAELCYKVDLNLERVYRNGLFLSFQVEWDLQPPSFASSSDMVGIFKGSDRQLDWSYTSATNYFLGKTIGPDAIPLGSRILMSSSAGMGLYNMVLYATVNSSSSSSNYSQRGVILANRSFLLEDYLQPIYCVYLDQLECIPADVGQTRTSDGILCAEGIIARQLSFNKCPPCTAGLFGSKSCQPCPIGSYNNLVGATACTSCFVGTTVQLSFSTLTVGTGTECVGGSCCIACPVLISQGLLPPQCMSNGRTEVVQTTAAPPRRLATTALVTTTAAKTSATAAEATTEAIIVTTPAPTSNVDRCGNGVRETRSSSCWVELFGGVKLCDAEKIVQDGAGRWHLQEECDDGNTRSGDGCSQSCTIEEGYICSAASPSVCSTSSGDDFLLYLQTQGSFLALMQRRKLLGTELPAMIGSMDFNVVGRLGGRKTFFPSIFRDGRRSDSQNDQFHLPTNSFQCLCSSSSSPLTLTNLSGLIQTPVGFRSYSSSCTWRMAPPEGDWIYLNIYLSFLKVRRRRRWWWWWNEQVQDRGTGAGGRKEQGWGVTNAAERGIDRCLR